MVLNDLSVTFIPITVFKHSRKGKLFDNLYIDNMQTRNYALYHVLGNILPEKIGIKVWMQTIMLQKPFKVTFIVIMKRWVKDIFILNNIVEFSPHSFQVNEQSRTWRSKLKIYILKQGCWKKKQKKSIKHNVVHTLFVLNLHFMG